jgi:hypothetical protein
MSKWHEKLDVTDPEKQIGTTPDGKPIWIDMRELLTSPDEKQELAHNTTAMQQNNAVNQMANDVLDNGRKLLEQTLLRTLKTTEIEFCFNAEPNEALNRISNLGFECIQDGLTTVIKRKGKILRTMTARVPLRFRQAVDRRVRSIVRNK